MSATNVNSTKKNYYLIYTFVFSITCLLAFSCYFTEGKSFIWFSNSNNIDGLTQHYTALAYYGNYLREVLRTIFLEHSLQIPTWDLKIGFGSDIISTLNYYVFGDPLTLLSVFVPAKHTEILYNALVILRLYLAGISFSLLCKHFQLQQHSTLMGSLVYVFTQYSLLAGTRHPFFLNPMIYLPLLILGIEKIFKKKSPFLFIVTVALSAMSNFYFFYMSCIFMFLYAVFRYVTLFGGIHLKEVTMWLGRFIGFYALGVGIASPIFLPNIFSILGSSRITMERHIPLFYDTQYYSAYPGGILGSTPGDYTLMGYASIAFISLFLLFSRKGKNTALKIGYVLLTLFTLFPYAGHVFNGFSYSTNRWIWGLNLLVAYVVAKMLPEIFTMTSKKAIACIASVVLYCLIVVSLEGSRTVINLGALVSLILMIGMIALFHFHKRLSQKASWANLCLLFLTVLGIFTNAYLLYAPTGWNVIAQFLDQGKSYSKVMNSPTSLMKAFDGIEETARCDTASISMVDGMANSGMLQGVNGIPFYFSSTNPFTTQYFNELYLNMGMEHYYLSLDGRTFMNALAGSEYTVVPQCKEKYLPQGYTNKIAGDKGYALYHSSSSLPFSYSYDSYISRDTYENLSVTQRQQALLEGCVVEESVNLPETTLDFQDQTIKYQASASEDITIQSNKFVVNKPNSVLTLNFKGVKNSENYLIFENLHFKDNKKTSRVDITIKGNEQTKHIYYMTENAPTYASKNNRLCNLGYSQEGIDRLTLTFQQPGTYLFSNLKVICQPMGLYYDTLKKRKETQLTNIHITHNRITGTTVANKNQLLCITVPYSRGWSATIDGQEAPVIQANTMYTGLFITPGKHEIQLHYETPYLNIGIIICLASLCLCGSLFKIGGKKK